MYKIPADSMRKKKNDIGLFDDSETVEPLYSEHPI